ncbi:hypothetical protein Tco_0863263 [Tanacetum coccineum]
MNDLGRCFATLRIFVVLSIGGLARHDSLFLIYLLELCNFGNPVDGLYCRHCVFVRKCLNEGWYTIHDENEILNTSESSNYNTNVVSRPQEPVVFNQDPGENSSQSPLQINHNCCYKCGDLLDALIISNREPCNQTINEFPQTLPSVHQTCNYEYENSFTYNSKLNSLNDSPSVLTHPPQLQFETYLCELCGNNVHYGYDCPPQFPLVYEQESCYNQHFNDNYFPQNSQSSSQKYLCCENCGGPHKTFQCQPMNEDSYEQNSCYYPNSFGFDQYQPPQFLVIYPPQETSKEIFQAQEDLMEAIQAFLKEYDHIPPNEKCMALLLAEERFLKIKQTMEEEQNQPGVIQELLLKLMDDLQILKGSQQEKKETAAQIITPDEPSEEPEDPLIMGEKELSTFPKEDKSSVEDLVQIPSGSKEEFTGEFAHIPPGMDEDEFDEEEVDCYDHDISSDNESYANIEYVEASPLNLEYDNEDQEEKEFHLEDIFQIQDVILREKLLNVHRLITNIKSLKNNLTPDHMFKFLSSVPIFVTDSGSFFEESDTLLSHSDNYLPEFETFSDHTEETRSGSTTTHANDSLPEIPPGIESDFDSEGDIIFSNDLLNDDPIPEYERFTFDIEPDAPVINNFDELNEDEYFDPGGGEIDFSQNVKDDDSFTFVIRTFLPFLTYPEDSLSLFFTGSEDTIFNPGIST